MIERTEAITEVEERALALMRIQLAMWRLHTLGLNSDGARDLRIFGPVRNRAPDTSAKDCPSDGTVPAIPTPLTKSTGRSLRCNSDRAFVGVALVHV